MLVKRAADRGAAEELGNEALAFFETIQDVALPVQDQIDALAADPARVIWQDGLPTTIRASLAPYRDRLETSYSCAMNIFELSQNRKQGWSIRSE